MSKKKNRRKKSRKVRTEWKQTTRDEEIMKAVNEGDIDAFFKLVSNEEIE